MNIIFLNSETLVARELSSALGRRKDFRYINMAIPFAPHPDQAQEIFDRVKPYTPALFISINDAGYDLQGRLHNIISASGSYQVNWYHDYPFFDHIFKNRPLPLSSNRIDLISELSYVDLLRSKGVKSYFLPLATDLSIFNNKGECQFKRDLAFVGQSSLGFMDTIIDEDMADELERFSKLFLVLKKLYSENPTISLREYLIKHNSEWIERITIPEEKFIFAITWMVGYIFRRDFIVDIAKKYPNDFTIFGDGYWERFVNKKMVSTKACYYDNLCNYYRSTKINLNINRIQIRTSFTQRHFDCKACGAFLLTDKRELNSRFFKTQGSQKEMVEYESLSHCKELIDYYLTHEDERLKIAECGISSILRNHTYDIRIDEMKKIFNNEWGI